MDEQNQPKESTLTEETTLFSWRAPARPFKKRSRDFFTTVVSIAALLGIILFFIEGLMPVLVIVAVVFLTFILFSVSPEEVDYAITSKNIKIGESRYPIEGVSRFWISERFGQTLLILETPLRFPGRLELVLSGVEVEELKKALSRQVAFEQAPPTFLDKAASWFSKRLPIESS